MKDKNKIIEELSKYIWHQVFFDRFVYHDSTTYILSNIENSNIENNHSHRLLVFNDIYDIDDINYIDDYLKIENKYDLSQNEVLKMLDKTRLSSDKFTYLLDETEYKEYMNYKKGISDLKEALEIYSDNMSKELKKTEDKDYRIKISSMHFCMQWMLNSLGREEFCLHKRHSTNITKKLDEKT